MINHNQQVKKMIFFVGGGIMYLKDELVLSKLDGVLLSDLVILRDIWWKKAPKMLQKTQTWDSEE